ncbi:hypothetical protein [Actinomadura sp. DC4]|uniref:hypothetical protein n=1 Tax=Actinomadura sp. DC4 TaxID=3055069 RepID=UPI0025AF2B4F|nr:hypothetical protein [Actinomadura sp. DC4]MDN3359265.1 hypothetical protein [Actinomadura sp. DC4]
MIDDGDVSFGRMEAADLIGTVAAVPQALDNQWFDRGLLDRVLRAGRVDEDVAAGRARRSRAEYLRALLAAEKIIVNRAYLYNNPVVYRDYLRKGADREAFRDLLREGAIVPWLLGEPSPVPSSAPEFETAEGLQAWREVAESTSMSCIRLSWDEEENARLSRGIGREYNRFVLDFTQLDVKALRRDLALDDDAHAESVLKRLRTVSRWVHDELDADRPVTRQRLYEKFVVVDGRPVTEYRYDAKKPHAAQVKQLLDLKYATNLADSVDVFSITPGDSPRRTALQEGLSALRGRGDLDGTDSDELIGLLRNLAFENVQELLEAVPSLDRLSLVDVHDVRREQEWEAYRRTFSALVNSPSVATLADPDTGAEAITKSYLTMVRKAEEISLNRREEEWGQRFNGMTQLGIDLGSLTINAFFLNGHAPAFEIIGDALGMASSRAAKVTIRWGVGRVLGRASERRIDNTAQILTLRMENPSREARRLLEYVRGKTELPPERGNGQDMSDEDE